MCTTDCIRFIVDNTTPAEIRGKTVLEVGARAVQGPELMIRPWIERFKPASYLGVDIASGSGVDEICNAETLSDRFGNDAFDVVISTELLEHVRDWKTVITNLKRVVRPGGVIFITTRSYGVRFHGYPSDYWRFEMNDMKAIFSDFTVVVVEKDPSVPGVFLKAVKPSAFREAQLAEYRLYSVLTGTRRRDPPSQVLDDVARFGLTTRGFRRLTHGILRVTGAVARTGQRLICGHPRETRLGGQRRNGPC